MSDDFNNKENKIDELKKRLDSRNFNPSFQRPGIRSEKKPIDDIKTNWKTEEKEFVNNENLGYQMAKKRGNFLKIFMWSSAIFFALALAVALYVIFGGSNIISSDNVEISVSGPVSISGGETLSLDLVILNKNNTSLELADLIVEYPEGTRSPKNLSIELPRERFSLGNIKSGESVEQEINAILFGEEGSREEIKITVEYRVAGSSAIFFKERSYEIEISSSPVSFRVESLNDVSSGKELTLNVFLKSNSNNLIEDLMLIAEYPFGWTFKNSSPRPTFDQNIWRIGDFSPGEEREIKITGILEGQDDEERVFRFFSGIQNRDNEREIETAFVSSLQSVFIKKPFLSLDLVVDGSTAQNVNSEIGKLINVDILWENNLSTNVANVEIEAVLKGDFNESSVSVDRGFYNSSTNTVLWSQDRNPNFESLSPGQEGTLRFKFRSLDFDNFLKNPEVVLEVSVRGRRLSERNVSEEVTSTATKEIRFNTNLSLNSKILHFSGPISNSGPIPPKAEVETTYTVIWTLNNTVNNSSNVLVSTTLPPYIRWTGITDSAGETLNYNSVTREVTWDVGRVSALSGSSLGPREVAFQIAFLPSLSQVGEAPVLVNKTKIFGKDDFTGSLLGREILGLTTKITTDPGFKNGDDMVVE